ncbi:hypothetical protein F2P81_012238 [Scophthalmus maximus]|uniref:Uncharacterized protein n=1 Tax=Scophthalmus maximus TaxID=52904 RepID=A0A6A4SRE7_SCOMX|nr:hypothetical protein F2P81_012238 [Scophthalmus maximus]
MTRVQMRGNDSSALPSLSHVEAPSGLRQRVLKRQLSSANMLHVFSVAVTYSSGCRRDKVFSLVIQQVRERQTPTEYDEMWCSDVGKWKEKLNLESNKWTTRGTTCFRLPIVNCSPVAARLDLPSHGPCSGKHEAEQRQCRGKCHISHCRDFSKLLHLLLCENQFRQNETIHIDYAVQCIVLSVGQLGSDSPFQPFQRWIEGGCVRHSIPIMPSLISSAEVIFAREKICPGYSSKNTELYVLDFIFEILNVRQMRT